ncbi:run domain Beclin-1-interacting and cysteine-rich domain-containing protein [Cylas formicarius]|uniref:run domain Beclin-1-interacting and cysteine-rich domain-containing protein n=1 Tax=Cylas formicarius TaxID=197179 RepID=UPI0029586488|nr:run domain Beclin-1-interacting and cysteine-rich domain-containing protein [Cylas formicarius]
MNEIPLYQQYLRDLKQTVEGLLVTQVANVWSIYGGLNRLHGCFENIFRHGCKQSKEEGGFYNFIQGLEWLQPETYKSYFNIDCEYKAHIPQHFRDDKCLIWLYRSLETHSLSQRLSWLLSDNTHLLTCYQPTSYLCQEKYAEATLICLRAVERNQPSLLSEINPCLFLYKTRTNDFVRIHRRCSSFPGNQIKIFEQKTKNSAKSLRGIVEGNRYKHQEHKIVKIHGKLKPWSSLPSLLVDNLNINERKFIVQSRTTPNTPIHTKRICPNFLKVDYEALQKGTLKSSLKRCSTRQKHVGEVIIQNCDIVEHVPSLSSSHSSGITVQNDVFPSCSTASPKSSYNVSQSPLSMVEYSFLPMPGEKDFRKKPHKSFIEDGGMSVLPMATGYFPKPTKGQTLTSFLTSSHFAKTNAELDKENAHFNISEAIISAMEQLKCKRDLKLADEQLDESDPEILDLKQRIRLRRRQKIVENQRKQWSSNFLSDGKTDTTTTVSPCSTPPDSSSGKLSSDDIDDLEIDQASNLDDNHGLSMSMASLYSDADIAKKPRGAPDGASDILSAEGVALSLISKFNEKHLPRASDLEWLVSEEDAPQALLPLPKSWPVSPDDPQEIAIPLRGTKDWAPPRPQIVLSLHPSPSRKLLMEKQFYRCAGCGMRVAQQYAMKFRYCEYLGKYFCTGCHKNQVALIPARVLHKWDFNRYPVSTFSYKLLEQMYLDPLFRVFELNKNIGKLSKNLIFIHKYRVGLLYLKEYIFSCRFAETVQETMEQELPVYFLTKPDEYSMDDLVNIKNGNMKAKMKYLVGICCKHTSECKLCLARGFICEICKRDEIIFPWQMRIVTRCGKCFSCYHTKCWNSSKQLCEKCERIMKRKYDSAEDSKM